MMSNFCKEIMEEESSDGNGALEARNLVVHADEAPFVKASPNVVEVSSLMTNLSESFKAHLDQAMTTMKDQNKRNAESILAVTQQESAKRASMEQRLHSLILLQNERMAAMELKLLRLEAKVERREASIRQQQQSQSQQQRSHSYTHQTYTSNRLPPTFTTINESALEMPLSSRLNANNSSNSEETPPNMAVISSGASLASGVTAGSFLGEDGEDDGDQDDRSENRSDTLASDSGNPVTRELDEEDEDNREDDNQHESQQSTPTQGSRPRVSVGDNGNGTLESILLNPMIGESGLQGLSVRATRGFHDTDGNSSLATSVTNSTFTSTVVTATTRGDLSTINVRRLPIEEQSEIDILTPSRRGRSNFAEDPLASREEPRSRSQSPLTVNTHASETLSMASASTVGTSIRSSVAVAPRSGFSRRSLPSNHPMVSSIESRPLADRVVSFTPDLTSLPAPPYSVEATDSITMPDELDNISEVADTFASSARVWREEYEARLDALHKRWSNE